MAEKSTVTSSEAAQAKPVSAGKKGHISAIILTLSILLGLAMVWSSVRSVQKQYESELNATYESLANSRA